MTQQARLQNIGIGLSVKRLYFLLFLGVFALFLSMGNFFRICQLSLFPSHYSLVEGVLYLLAAPIYFSKPRKSQLLIVCIGISTLYGTLLHGVDWTALLYSFKLMGMIAAGVGVGEGLYFIFADRFDSGIGFLIKIYSIMLVFGWIIFFLFPSAEVFFQFLLQYGIQFGGDPHQRRFISTLFDPNFYSAIACLPFLFTWILKDKYPYYYPLSLLFLASILLSWSRSGIGTCLILIGAMTLYRLFHLKGILLRPKRLLGALFLISVFTLSFSFFQREFFYFSRRTIDLGNDPSAYARLESFIESFHYFWKYPLFGTGFNYLTPFLKDNVGISTPDSSLLHTVGNFGIIPTFLFALLGIVWSIRRFQSLRVLKEKNIFIGKIFSWLYIYLLICIMFSGQFNNLLYYQFWLIPIIAIFTYCETVVNINSE